MTRLLFCHVPTIDSTKATLTGIRIATTDSPSMAVLQIASQSPLRIANPRTLPGDIPQQDTRDASNAPPTGADRGRANVFGSALPKRTKGPPLSGRAPHVMPLRAGIGPAPDLRARPYGAFGFLPGAGAGTYPDTRHGHASIVVPPS